MKYIDRLAEKHIITSLKNPKVLFILGARQVGKTTLIDKILRDQSRASILNLDLAVDKAKLEAAATLPPSEALAFLGNQRFLAFDEAHRFPEIGRIAKGWYDAKLGLKIILLGSSSLNLLNKTAESLLGRNEKVYLTPLLFSEILSNTAWYPDPTSKFIHKSYAAQIQTILLQSLVYGSYPEAVATTDKENYLINVVTDLLLIDLLQSDLVRTPDTIRKLLLLLSYQIGSEVSVHELANQLSVSRQTIEKYLDYLERVFIIFRLPGFSTNPRKEISKTAKIFFWDTGIRNALQKEFTLSPLRSDIGALWENWVIAEFMKKNLAANLNQQFYFWRSVDGSEVDLIIKDKNRLRAYEIKWSATRSTARKAFSNKYGVRPRLINRGNFADILLS